MEKDTAKAEKKEEKSIKALDWTKKAAGIPYHIFFAILAGVILVGVGGGYLIATYGPKLTAANSSPSSKQGAVKGVGIADKKEFPDQVEGMLKEGGIGGEGNFHLERKGGESQNAYLTSSTVDLSKFIGKRVRVWGKTYKGEKAGWLLDVGFVENL